MDPRREALPPDPARVLVVDDTADHLVLIRRVLERARSPRLLVEVTEDPEDAERRIGETAFDAILLDYRLPGTTGLDLLKRINRDARRPVIVLTAVGDERVAVEFFHAGAYDYLPKRMDKGFDETLLRAVRDLLLRRRLEEEIDRERRRNSALIESIPTLVCCLDPDLTIRQTNRAFRVLLREWSDSVPRDEESEIVGCSLLDLLPVGEPLSGDLERLTAALRAGTPLEEELELSIGGQMRAFWVVAAPLNGKGVVEGSVLTLTDVTHVRSTQRQRIRLARAVDASLDGVVITDARGRIEYANPAFSRLTGYEPQELRLRRTRFPQISPGVSDVGATIRENLARGEQWQGEVVNRRKDGSLYHADMTISPIRDDAGKLFGFVSVERDVTDRKVFTDELIRARESAEEALRAKDMFLATVSHELRTPLTSIIGFADLLLLDPSLAEHVRAYSESIMRGGRHLKRLIENILDLSRCAAGRFYLDLEPLPLRGLLEEAREMVRSEAEGKTLALHLEIDPELPEKVVVDRMKLEQVLLNLLTNAVKFSERGAIRLSARPLFEEGVAGRSARTILFSVRDEGPGIPEEKREQIFEDFVQLQGAAQGKQKGTGLGLAISRRLVELMGGTIWVESEIDRGSCFTFTIPLTPADEELAPSQPASDATEGSGPTLLVHEIGTGAIPGESEWATWGYRTRRTGSVEELEQAIRCEPPFAAIVATGVEISAAFEHLRAVDGTIGGSTDWFLIARTPEGAPIPLGRIATLHPDFSPRSVSRFLQAWNALPIGGRRILLDPQDCEGIEWARSQLGDAAAQVLDDPPGWRVAERIGEDGAVLMLDLDRAANRALSLWREASLQIPRLLTVPRYRDPSDEDWRARIDLAWRETAPGLTERLEQRSRWMLNAIHTRGSRERSASEQLFGAAWSAAQTDAPLPPPDRPILVVEDDEENRHLISRMLDSLHLPRSTARCGQEALAVAARERPCLVLMDIELPGMDGFAATQALRRQICNDHLPIIAMTGLVGPQDRRRCHEAGCVDLLAKPITRADLTRILRRWLRPAQASGARALRPSREPAARSKLN